MVYFLSQLYQNDSDTKASSADKTSGIPLDSDRARLGLVHPVPRSDQTKEARNGVLNIQSRELTNLRPQCKHLMIVAQLKEFRWHDLLLHNL